MWMTSLDETVPTSDTPRVRLLHIGYESVFYLHDFHFLDKTTLHVSSYESIGMRWQNMYTVARCRECVARFLVLVANTIVWELRGVGEEDKNNLAF